MVADKSPSLRSSSRAQELTARGQRKKKTRLSKYNKEIYEKAKVEDQDWYVGMLTAEDIDPFMQQHGDFAVRASHARKYFELVLTIRNDDSATKQTYIIHLPLVCDKKDKKWTLKKSKSVGERMLFDTIADLIKYYKDNFLPLSPPHDKLKLGLPCNRPKWLLKRANIDIDHSKKLGAGNFCEVFAGKLNGKRSVAVKTCITVNDDQKSEEQLNQEFVAQDSLIKEGKIMESIRHQNIIRFIGICFDKSLALIVMELCSGGSLLDHLVKAGVDASSGERLKYCQEVAEGMGYLHKQGLIHRDLAARNCLISKDGIIKIADFGLSKLANDLAPEGTDFRQQIPVRWMAPETIQRDPKFSEKSDMWAYGVLVFEIFGNGAKPFDQWENKKIATYIRRGQMPELSKKTPIEISNLVKGEIWQLDPSKRPTFAQALEEVVKIQPKYPCPALDLLTLNRIRGVKAAWLLKSSKHDTGSEDVAQEAYKVAVQRTDDSKPSRETITDDITVRKIEPKKNTSKKSGRSKARTL